MSEPQEQSQVESVATEDLRYPAAGTTWRYDNGIEYYVIGVANVAEGHPGKHAPIVIYRNARTGTLWARPLSVWHRRFRYVYKPFDPERGTL
jgi:hypothetical protein